MDRTFLNFTQDEDFCKWEPKLAQTGTDAVHIDIPCTRNGSTVTAKLIFRASIARHDEVDQLPFLRP